MTDHQNLAQQYVALWNETNPDTRQQAAQRLFTPDASYLDPQMQGSSPDGIAAMIGAAQTQLPGLRFRLSDQPVDAHHDYLRFSWLLGPDEQTDVAGGTDIVHLSNGKMRQVIGFIDFAPAGQ